MRIFKTRSLAAEACELEKVKINGQPVKASRMIGAGSEITVKYGPFERSFKIINPVQNRLPAKSVAEFCTETTPESVLASMKAHAAARAAWRLPGMGRPTKKERRELDDYTSLDDW